MNRWMYVLLVALVAALLASLAVLVLRDDEFAVTVDVPAIVDVSQLSEFAAEASEPIYWLGERPGAEYELTETSSGRIYVRYLRGGAEAGDERADFVTVATYPADDGIATLRRVAREQEGAKLDRTDDGAVLLIDPTSPNNAYLAYPGSDLQIEVFSPVRGQAQRLAARGDVQPLP